jgi:hypothetical protein
LHTVLQSSCIGWAAFYMSSVVSAAASSGCSAVLACVSCICLHASMAGGSHSALHVSANSSFTEPWRLSGCFSICSQSIQLGLLAAAMARLSSAQSMHRNSRYDTRCHAAILRGCCCLMCDSYCHKVITLSYNKSRAAKQHQLKQACQPMAHISRTCNSSTH